MFDRLIKYLLDKFRPIDKKSIDRTGMIFSDYPKPGRGWMKGWLVNTPSRDVIILCRHGAPSEFPPNNKVYAITAAGQRVERTLVRVDQTVFDLEGAGKPSPYYLEGDISVCKVDAPFPVSIKAYDFVKDPKVTNAKVFTIDQFGDFSEARYDFEASRAWVRARFRRNQLEGGDSGTPWFLLEDREWRVLTHSSRGWWGKGPNYAHPLIWKKLQAVIAAFSKKA